jgi:hypothetical protein
MLPHPLHDLVIILETALLFLFLTDLVPRLLVLLVSHLHMRRQPVYQFGRMLCQRSSLFYSVLVLGRFFLCLLMLFSLLANGYSKLRQRLMALYKGTRLALLLEDFSRPMVVIMMRLLLLLLI